MKTEQEIQERIDQYTKVLRELSLIHRPSNALREDICRIDKSLYLAMGELFWMIDNKEATT